MFRFKVEHTIEYDGCDLGGDAAVARTVRFKSSKNYISYEEKEQVYKQGKVKNKCFRTFVNIQHSLFCMVRKKKK